MAIKIKPMMRHNLTRCIPIFEKAYAEPPYNEKWERRESHHYLTFFFQIGRGASFILQNEEEIIGFILGYVYPFGKQLQYHVQELVIHPNHQRKGYGSQLLDEAVARVDQGVDTVVMLAGRRDDKPMNFYEKLGFSAVDDLVLLQKRYETKHSSEQPIRAYD